jgi:hypothetical protein
MLNRRFSDKARARIKLILISGFVMAAVFAYAMLRNDMIMDQKHIFWVFPMVFIVFSIFMLGFATATGFLTELLLSAINGRRFSRDIFTLAALIFHIILLVACCKILFGIIFFGQRL